LYDQWGCQERVLNCFRDHQYLLLTSELDREYKHHATLGCIPD